MPALPSDDNLMEQDDSLRVSDSSGGTRLGAGWGQPDMRPLLKNGDP